MKWSIEHGESGKCEYPFVCGQLWARGWRDCCFCEKAFYIRKHGSEDSVCKHTGCYRRGGFGRNVRVRVRELGCRHGGAGENVERIIAGIDELWGVDGWICTAVLGRLWTDGGDGESG